MLTERQITAAFKGLTKRLPKKGGNKKGLSFRPDLTMNCVSQLHVWKIERNRKTRLREGRRKVAAGVPLAREIAGLKTTLKRF